MATAYAERLKHPKWQKRRLEILHRDEFTCQLCGDTDSTLHIHHKVYRKCEIWEYKDNELITYCELCHLVVEYFKEQEGLQEVIIVRKEDSDSELEQINLFVLLKIDNNYFISILYFNKYSNKLTFIVGMKKVTLNRINSLVNEYSK